MISNRNKKLKIICSLVILLAICLVPFTSVSPPPVQAVEEPRVAPINPDFLEFWENPPETFYGYIPPLMDLSHLDEIPVEGAKTLVALPVSFDWRDSGKVTSIKNQAPCGTCWVFGTTSVLESAVLIAEGTEYNFSEQSVALCVDRSWVYLYDDPDEPCGSIPGHGGGNSFRASEVFIKKGAILDSCNPYDGTDLQCDGTCVCDDCPPIKKVNGYRYVTGDQSQTGLIKDAVSNHGPVTMAFYYDDSHEYQVYLYGTVYDCATCTSTNHIVSIIGWNDSVPHVETPGTGAWLVKNSWGTGWGNAGYFWLAYDSSYMTEIAYLEYGDYDPAEQIYYWDEAGWVGDFGNWNDYSGWMANIFTSEQSGSLTHVDFWTTSKNAEYQIYVYLNDDPSDGLGSPVSSKSGTCQECGYYSIPLTSPVSLTNGQAFTIAVKMTTPGYKWPIPVEYQYNTTIVDPTMQIGKSFFRHEDGESWTDAATVDSGYNICLRARVTTGAAIVAPMATTSAATSVEETTATLNGMVSNDGGEACQYRFQYDTNSGEPYAYSTGWTGSKTSGQSFSAAISALSKGTKYYFRAQCKNSAGTASGSELTFLTKPDAPTGFSATAASTTQINLSWTKGAGAQKTKIQRKQGSYPANRNDGTQVYFDTGTSTPDTGLSLGTTYYYRAWSYVLGSEQWSDNYAQAQATTAGAQPDVPDITISPPSFEESGPPGTSWTRTLTIGNVGNVELNYTLTDTETTAGASTGKAENLLLKPANMALGLPLEGSPIEPENTPEGGNGWQYIMTDGFEGTFPGVKWQLYGDPTWGKESYRQHTGSYSAWCAGSSYNPPSNYPNNMEAWMVYGPFSLADATDAELNFWFWNKSQGPDDYLFWGASTTGGQFYGSGHNGDSAGWQSVSFDLTDVYTLGNLCGQSQVWIGFFFGSDESTTDKGAFIDDVVLRKYVGGAADDCPWLDEEPKSGSVAPGGHDDITVTFDTTGLGSTYTANIVILSNDPDEPHVTVPVTLTVTTGVAPSVSIAPPSQTVPPGGTCDIDVWVDAAGRGLNGIDVAVQYNSDAMTTSGADVEAHNLMGGIEIGPQVNEAGGMGEVTYALASGTAVGGVDGSVMTITFTMDAGAGPGDYPLTTTKADLADLTGIWGDTEINDATVTVGIGRKGDFNGDGDIDIFDFVMFAAAYGSELGDDNYNPAGDFNDDGDIDIFDFVLFAAVYGT